MAMSLVSLSLYVIPRLPESGRWLSKFRHGCGTERGTPTAKITLKSFDALVDDAILPKSKGIANCPRWNPRNETPTSVYNLTISDIKVIAALGDSITAGFGAKAELQGNKSILIKTFENRGVIWIPSHFRLF